MSSTLQRRMTRAAAALAVSGAAVAAAAPSSASAADTFRNCTANVLEGSILTAQLPAVASVGGSGTCASASGGVGQLLPAPLNASVLATSSNVVEKVGAGSSARVADLQLGIPGGVLEQVTAAIRGPLTQGTTQINQALSPLAGLAGGASIDVTPAVNALLTLPQNANLLSVQAVEANAAVQCANGRPNLTSASRIVGTRVLGATVDANTFGEQAINLVDTQNINLAQLDLTRIQVKDAQGNPIAANISGLVLSQLQTALRLATATIPPVNIPAQVLRVKLTAGQETKGARDVKRTALRAEVGLVGQSVVDLRVINASAGFTDNPCRTEATQAGQAQLQCSGRKISLTDASIRGSRVRYRGFVDQSYAARYKNRIGIKGTWFGKTRRTAATTVQKDGTFRGSFKVTPLIRQRFRQAKDNDVRAYATVGRFRSAGDLKLARRLNTDTVAQRSNGRVRFAGRATSPRSGTRQVVQIRERLGCSTKERTVARGRLKSNGKFTVDVRKPKQAFAYYRAVTKVIATDKRTGRPNGRLSPTFTVLNPIDIKQ